MAKQDQLNAAIARLETATTEIASDMKKLRDEIATGSVTDESLATLDANIAKLESLGAEDGETDPDAPVVE